MNVILILVTVLVLIFIFLWSTYNGLITARVRVDQSFKDIDIQLKKRYDLLPDLVETAKKATSMDEKIFTEVAKVRSDAMKAQETGASVADRAKAENQLSGAIRDIKVAVEAYPDIKSHTELTDLMSKVTDVEEKIAYSRQFYNSNVGDYNTKVKLFPAVLVASYLGFKEAEFFSAPEDEKKDVKVTF